MMSHNQELEKAEEPMHLSNFHGHIFISTCTVYESIGILLPASLSLTAVSCQIKTQSRLIRCPDLCWTVLHFSLRSRCPSNRNNVPHLTGSNSDQKTIRLKLF
ncbi:hypothetical protein ATANTOWER_002289 [Ataeniobius toweri]|uniref:Uncharacterized protein n=1 Tax=Ataeniobius toweri TaxID=208326 RepID=A0ABU7BDB9_9TELE|nr:hypothetical protein [Ataeniobius toweri]